MLSSIDQCNLQRHERWAALLVRQWLRCLRSEQQSLVSQTESLLVIHIQLLSEFADQLYNRAFPKDIYARMAAYWALSMTKNDLLQQKMRQSLAEDQASDLKPSQREELQILIAHINKEEMNAA